MTTTEKKLLADVVEILKAVQTTQKAMNARLLALEGSPRSDGKSVAAGVMKGLGPTLTDFNARIAALEQRGP